jgi:3-(3-hydroxy-phenyl)propionate hydroxylase
MEPYGITAQMEREGIRVRYWQIRDRRGELVAQFDLGLLAGETEHPYRLHLEQHRLTPIQLELIRSGTQAEVHFGYSVTGVENRADRVLVHIEGDDGPATIEASWLIGADGGRSTVRKQCGIAFDGFTWPERFIVFTTPYDFEAKRGYCPRSYFADPGSWCNCFKVSADGPPGLWRTVFPTDPSRPEADVTSDAAVQALMQKFFPSDEPYEVVHRNLYTTHQRVAATFRSGRVVLAGDSAHVNNPIGGMGLNGGIQDAVNLCDKLAQVLLESASERLLDLYSLQRRTVAIEFVQEQSIANKNRLEARDPEARRKNLDDLRRVAADPERARQFLLRTAMIASQRRAASLELSEA